MRRDPFIRNEWAVLERHIQFAYFLTIFGYSAPNTDAAAREAMTKVWGRNATREFAEVELIDIKPNEQLHATWSEFITREHYISTDSIMKSYVARHPRRSCDALFAATMMNEPWKNDWLPELADPAALREWVDPLWREEIDLSNSGGQFSGNPCRKSQ